MRLQIFQRMNGISNSGVIRNTYQKMSIRLAQQKSKKTLTVPDIDIFNFYRNSQVYEFKIMFYCVFIINLEYRHLPLNLD